MKPLRPATPGGPLYAEDLNALFAEVQRLSRLTGEGVDVDSGPTGVHLRVEAPDPGFWALITGLAGSGSGGGGSGSGSGCGPGEGPFYAYAEYKPVQCGNFEAVAGGRSGDYAFEANNAPVPIPSFQFLRPAAAWADGTTTVREWVFTAGSGLCDGSGSGAGTPLTDLIQCESGSGSGSGGGTQIRNVNLAVNVCGRLYPVVALDPVTGEILG